MEEKIPPSTGSLPLVLIIEHRGTLWSQNLFPYALPEIFHSILTELCETLAWRGDF